MGFSIKIGAIKMKLSPEPLLLTHKRSDVDKGSDQIFWHTCVSTFIEDQILKINIFMYIALNSLPTSIVC